MAFDNTNLISISDEGQIRIPLFNQLRTTEDRVVEEPSKINDNAQSLLRNIKDTVLLAKTDSCIIKKCITHDDKVFVQKIEKKQRLRQRETDLLKQLDHKNIIKYIDSTENDLLIEYVPKGDLFDLLSTKGKFSERIVRYYFHQLIEALEHCHSKNIYHRDLKLENVLVDENFDLKLADFGLSKQYLNVKQQNTYVGTINYIAPELHEKKGYVPSQIDIFSLGVILFILGIGTFPFEIATNKCKFFTSIMNENYVNYWNAAKSYELSSEYKDLINRMICYDSEKRITLEEIKNHEWYKQDLISNEKLQQYMKSH